MRPAEVLRLQASLLDELAGPAGVQLQATAVEQDVVSADERDHVSQLCMAHVRFGRAYLITAHMTAAVAYRIQDTERLPPLLHCPTDVEPPHPSGFVLFETPLTVPEIRGRIQLCHALTWGRALSRDPRTGVRRGGWLCTTWNDVRREPDEVSRITLREYPDKASVLGRWWPVHSIFLHHDQRLGDVDRPTYPQERQQLEDKYGADPPVIGTVSNPRRMHVAVWQLLTETVHVRGATDQEIAYPDRGTGRWARRQHMQGDITVITLRRPAEPVRHPGTGTPLDHRVPVKQHRRTYWCKGEDGLLHPEKRTIGAHIRGPAGTPLVVTDKLERLSR